MVEIKYISNNVILHTQNSCDREFLSKFVEILV